MKCPHDGKQFGFSSHMSEAAAMKIHSGTGKFLVTEKPNLSIVLC